jgi:hypothetical protein
MTLVRRRVRLFYQRLFSGSALRVVGAFGWLSVRLCHPEGWLACEFPRLASDAALSRWLRVTEGGGHGLDRGGAGCGEAAAGGWAASRFPDSCLVGYFML